MLWIFYAKGGWVDKWCSFCRKGDCFMDELFAFFHLNFRFFFSMFYPTIKLNQIFLPHNYTSYMGFYVIFVLSNLFIIVQFILKKKSFHYFSCLNYKNWDEKLINFPTKYISCFRGAFLNYRHFLFPLKYLQIVLDSLLSPKIWFPQKPQLIYPQYPNSLSKCLLSWNATIFTTTLT